MLKKAIVLSVVVSITIPAYSIGYTENGQSWWGISDPYATNGSPGSFIVAGCIGRNCEHGTHGDEWAVVGIVASQIVEHGGYFCPYQIQCWNHKRESRTYTNYYRAHVEGAWLAKCAWLCEPGYGGVNCMPQDSAAYCDNTRYDRSEGGKYAGVYLKNWGGYDGECENEVFGFHAWMKAKRWERDLILGVVRFLDHGVVAAPVQISCEVWGKKSISWVGNVLRGQGREKILCATGYKLNSAGNDCVPIDLQMCGIDSMKTCPNFPKEAYDSSKHVLQESNGCAKYLCNDPDKAFPAAGNFDCTECGPGIKGGPNPENGVCIQCKSGEYFDKNTAKCKPARALTKSDMLYGKDKGKNTTVLKEQCWPLASPEEFKKCVNKQSD